MTEIEFHFNVPEKLVYGCRLLRKVYRSGARVVVVGEAEVLARLDEMLWRISPVEFVPHCLVHTNKQNIAYSPVLLAEQPNNCPASSVLINLGKVTPTDFERFERFIEVVTNEDEDRVTGRNRWKHYKDSGYALIRHDLTATKDVYE